MDKYQLLHDYNKLVRRDMANPLECNRCNIEYTVRLGPDEPVLKCYGCGGTLIPGDKLYGEILHVVETRLK